MFLVRIETDVWGGDTGKCKRWERGFREQFKNSSYIEKQSRDAQEDLLQEKKEGKEKRKSPKSSFSLTFTCSFWSRLPCSPVSPDLPPSQPLSSHLLNGVLCILITQSKHRRKKKQDICKHYQIQYGNPVSDLSEKSEPVSDSSNTVIIYTLTHLLKKETKP